MKKQLKDKNIVATVQLFSAMQKTGLEDAADVLGQWLNYPPQVQNEESLAVDVLP